MFKVLYILFFILVILLLQYLLNKPETFDNHLPDINDEKNLIQRQTSNSNADSCLDFNYLLQNYSSCCSGTKSSIGCRRPMCENALPIYNRKVDQYNQKVIDYNQSENAKKQLQSQYDTLESSIVDYMKYPGILSLGTSTKSSDISGADQNGCLDNISLETAKNNCNNSSDCNSFYSYNPELNARVCFKSEYGQGGAIEAASDINSGFFVKVQ